MCWMYFALILVLTMTLTLAQFYSRGSRRYIAYVRGFCEVQLSFDAVTFYGKRKIVTQEIRLIQKFKRKQRTLLSLPIRHRRTHNTHRHTYTNTYTHRTVLFCIKLRIIVIPTSKLCKNSSRLCRNTLETRVHHRLYRLRHET